MTTMEQQGASPVYAVSENLQALLPNIHQSANGSTIQEPINLDSPEQRNFLPVGVFTRTIQHPNYHQQNTDSKEPYWLRISSQSQCTDFTHSLESDNDIMNDSRELFDALLSDPEDPDYVPNSADSDSNAGCFPALSWDSVAQHFSDCHELPLPTSTTSLPECSSSKVQKSHETWDSIAPQCSESQELPASTTSPCIPGCSTSEVRQSNGILQSQNDPEKLTGFVVSGTGANKKRKKHYCFICGNPQAKLKRHLITQHKSEKDLIPLLNATSKTEQIEFEKLKSAGDHMHNIQVMRQGAGEVVVKRRKTVQVSIDNFVPCQHCRGWYSKKDLWRHKCASKSKDEHVPKRHVVKQGMLLLPQSSENRNFNEINASLRNDFVSLVAKKDDAIRLLGLREAIKNGHDKDRHGHIRNRLRELARLLIELRTLPNCEALGLTDFIRPERFQDIIKAVKKVSKFSHDSSTYGIPSLAIKLGHSLQRCCILLKAKAIETNDAVLLERTENYERLHSIKWEHEISAHATRTLYTLKKNTIKRIPLTEDVKKLSDHLSSETDKVIKTLESESFPPKSWERLAELSVARIILFNRRRQGEASKIKVSEVTQGLKSDTHNEDVLKELSPFEKALCKHLHRIEIIGKRGRIVPVLLTGSMKRALEILILKRNAVGVSPDNTYVFARTNSDSIDHIRGCDCIRKLVREADLKYPDKINSTGLRKHIATMTQLVNLQDNELDVVAQYLGHDIRTHREYYRLPTSTTQVAKVAKLLVAMEGSNAGLMSSELQTEDDIEYEEESPRDENTEQSDVESEDDHVALKDIHSPGSILVETGSSSQAAKVPKQRDMSKRRPWSDREKDACKHHFRRWLLSGTLPGKKEITDLQSKIPSLEDRTWIQIKNFIRNLIKKSE